MWLQFGWGSLGTARRRGLPVGVASQGPSLPRRFHHTIGRLVGVGGCQLGAQLGLWDWRLDSFSRASVMGLRTVWQQGPKRVSPDRQWELLAP